MTPNIFNNSHEVFVRENGDVGRNYSNSSILANLTALSPRASWNLLPVCTLAQLILALSGNILLLLFIYNRRSLWSPFNVYLVNLLIGNIFVVIVQYPFDMITDLYPDTQWRFGEGVCTFYLYSVFILQGITGNTHQLIAINRVWAVCYPLSYRTHHTFKTAIFLCIGVWFYSHLANMPGWILDAIFYRESVTEHGCQLNFDKQPTWAAFSQLVVYDLPVVTMVLSLVAIWVSKALRERTKNRRKNTITPCSIGTSEKGVRNASRTSGPTQRIALSKYIVETPVVQRRRSRRVHRNRGTLVLIMLTGSFLVTWLPINTYFTLKLFMEINWREFYRVATIIFSVQPVVDPLLFVLAVGSLRSELRQAVSEWWSVISMSPERRFGHDS